MGGSKAQRARRVRRVLELSTAGMTIPEISERMKSENFAASERTVWNDLNSLEAQQYQDEILRKQLTDITIAPIGLRLKYRGLLLNRMMPQKIESKAEVTYEDKKYAIILSNVGAKSWEQVKADQESTEDKSTDESNTSPKG